MTLINREDAIDELRRLIPYKKYHRGEWVHLLEKKEVFKALKSLPSAVCDDCIWTVCNYNKVDWDTPSAEAEWVPCSERLPEKGELVLVTVWNDITIAWRNIYGGWDSAEYMYEKGDVIAWMPLPKPYKGGDE